MASKERKHKTQSITVTWAELAMAFAKWNRESKKHPERFVPERRLSSKENQQDYGEACASYLMEIISEQGG